MISMNRKAGYSLVEVSLALLVVGVGLLAVFALFPDALGSSRKSVEASEISEFAEYVFATIEGMIAEPDFNWDDLKSGYQLPKTDALVFDQPRVVASGVKRGYEWLPNYFDVPGVAKYAPATFTYILTVNNVAGTSLKSAKLVVWAGANSNLSVRAGETFYREYGSIY